ncbi:MAG: NUDIX hydrolase, partial [Gammaproteobacteria bacterium]|nr:NUDIX hydrolase [Gammaproteobacteria bacterium]
APYRGGKVARYYLAESPGAHVELRPSPELGRPEHHEFRWLDHAGARELLAGRVRPALDWARDLIAGGARTSAT